MKGLSKETISITMTELVWRLGTSTISSSISSSASWRPRLKRVDIYPPNWSLWTETSQLTTTWNFGGQSIVSHGQMIQTQRDENLTIWSVYVVIAGHTNKQRSDSLPVYFVCIFTYIYICMYYMRIMCICIYIYIYIFIKCEWNSKLEISPAHNILCLSSPHNSIPIHHPKTGYPNPTLVT